MSRRIHEKLGSAGFVIAIVALVAALGGGAYAATNGLTGKQKKEVRNIAKQYAGKPGAPGTNGQNGAKGDKGANGDAGSQGAAGKDGGTGKEGKQGKEGSPWTAGGVLPAGKTETGTLGYTAAGLPAGKAFFVPISFPIPLAAPLGTGKVHLLTADGTKEIVMDETTLAGEEITPTGCGSALTPAGTAANPSSAPGNLCVYLTESTPELKDHAGSNFIVPPNEICEGFGCLPELGGPGSGAGVSGAMVELFGAEDYFGHGSWAVTAPQ